MSRPLISTDIKFSSDGINKKNIDEVRRQEEPLALLGLIVNEPRFNNIVVLMSFSSGVMEEMVQRKVE